MSTKYIYACKKKYLCCRIRTSDESIFNTIGGTTFIKKTKKKKQSSPGLA
jgi:hypothetical protein